jgi:cysteine desulfurase family protein
MRKIYLDNAATSFPKAPGVSEAITDYLVNVGSNVGRGTYESSYSAGQVVYETRELLCDMFNFYDPLKVVFTMNITQSLNMILKGLLKSGDHVIVSSMEHNAVIRPLTTLKESGVEFDRVPCDAEGRLNPEDIEKSIRPNTKLVVLTHASNVCGTIMPIEEIGKICRKHNIYFVIDAAQSAGVLEVDFKKLNLNGLTFTGHKGLLGPQGIGGFLVDTQLANNINPFIEGGTGSLSESEIQPDYMPDKFESGTLNIPGIYGLHAAIRYVRSTGIKTIHDIEMALTKRFLDGVLNISDINVIGPKGIEDRTAVVSLDFPTLDNSEVAFMLDREYGIMTRVGLHCAPSAHKTLLTFPKGTVRFSFGHLNTNSDIDYAIECIDKTIKSLK